LRGGWADPFARTADRRLDAALLAWFEGVMDRIARDHDRIGPDRAVRALAAVGQIRGYGPVRHAAADRIRAEVEALLA
ncbi:DUF6537 domain-containing protein, partial [Paracoccus aestuarii]|uniref:DUF6537 domain-containing protein n=1 Tax=Paracoccus aestuarii TaxID=453842 RepID=UPI001476010B